MAKWFADTYGLLAHVNGSPEYIRLLSGGDYVTTALNACEYAHKILARGQGDALELALPPILNKVVEPGPEVALAAAQFKLDRLLAGAHCSYVDAWGYATARSLGLPFLTGDEDFRGVPGVKFVKE